MLNSKMFIWLSVAAICFIKVDGAFLQLYARSGDYTTVPLSSAGDLISSPYFIKSAPIVIFAHGYNSSPFKHISLAITDGYVKATNVNYMTLDWSQEVNPGTLGIAPGYTLKGIPNTYKVGKKLGEAVLSLIAAGIGLEQFHLIGHSLGAHLVGLAGKRLTQEGKYIPRITGLDPAGPVFRNKFAPIHGISSDNAAFVVSVHSVPGSYGTKESVGHVDIWLNCDKSAQPGCSNSSYIVPFGDAEMCSHTRAPLAYIESIRSPKAFPAIQAQDCQDWKNKKDANRRIIYMSEEMDTKARGNFYLRTNSEYPFGLGEKGL